MFTVRAEALLGGFALGALPFSCRFCLLVLGFIDGLTRLATIIIVIIIEHAEAVRVVRCSSSIIVGRLGSR